MAESIGRIIDALEDTPIPNILIFAGLFFILLTFVTKVGGFIEVQPAQQKWAAPIGIALLVFGLILALNTSYEPLNPQAIDTPQPIGCAAFLREGSVLNWTTADNSGTPVNRGTLRIETVDSTVGRWWGEKIADPKKSGDPVDPDPVDGNFKEAEMTLNNPNHKEIWSGNCRESEIEGDLIQEPNRRFLFSIRKP
ncbi:hypothetical protein VB780_29700 [Leptolyngbya sp. CCNP1308]|uniref:hypothetical protein n=1 Tax=Leptolyngbya sp. CCNP1308 TaxID=3110255 RepID=UPI002B1E90CB|nr:hypothetical protein [Leptolyngbya sp. CCNP1308]MEA5452783.1 hypothetical protein [Leptolyngbya sp. CCNP1308]